MFYTWTFPPAFDTLPPLAHFCCLCDLVFLVIQLGSFDIHFQLILIFSYLLNTLVKGGNHLGGKYEHFKWKINKMAQQYSEVK